MHDGRRRLASIVPRGRGPTPAINAPAAIACLFNAGDYDDKFVPKMLSYAEKNLDNIQNQGFGHFGITPTITTPR